MGPQPLEVFQIGTDHLTANRANRVAALNTFEGTLLSMMLSHRVAASNGKNGESSLLSAPRVAKLFDVQSLGFASRRGSEHCRLSDWVIGHYVRFKGEEIQHFVAERANQAA